MTSRREITIAGEKVWLCGMTGQVAGDKKWSESRVQSRNVVAGAYGHTVIDTKVNTRHEFWLVALDGEERLVEFFNSEVAVREGQMVTAIWGAGIKMQTGPYLMLSNTNAQSSNWLISNPKALLRRMGLSDPMVKFTLIGFTAAALFWFVFHAWLLGILLAAAGMIVGTQRRNSKASAMKQAVIEAMNLEIQSFASTQQPPITTGRQGMLAP